MHSTRLIYRRWLLVTITIIVEVVIGGSANGQAVSDIPQDFWRSPLLNLTMAGNSQGGPSNSSGRDHRFQLFRMPTGFARDPVGLDSDDDPPPPGDWNDSSQANSDSGPMDDGRLQVSLGTDNPFYDFRSPDDPGGIGYYKLYGQYQLIDDGTTSFGLGFQAVTPAGLEEAGLANGPTVVSPALAWYHELEDGSAFQGFIGKEMRASNRWVGHPDRRVQYGVAFQSPLAGDFETSGQCLHMFVEALGRYRYDGVASTQRDESNLELLPGLHWQVGENWWLAGGLIIPLGTTHLDTDYWQITCSWRF